MTKYFIKIFLAISVCAFTIAAQSDLPVNTETAAITDLRSLLASSKKENKPLLINFWATWCGPCRVEFPELVKIDADYRARGLNFAVVSIDNFGAMDSIVADFLRVYNSTMDSYLLDLNRAESYRAIHRIAPRAQYGIPLTLLYDKSGRLVFQKNGVIDTKILRTRIEKILPVKSRAEIVK